MQHVLVPPIRTSEPLDSPVAGRRYQDGGRASSSPSTEDATRGSEVHSALDDRKATANDLAYMTPQPGFSMGDLCCEPRSDLHKKSELKKTALINRLES
jgi:hypothetical protein